MNFIYIYIYIYIYIVLLRYFKKGNHMGTQWDKLYQTHNDSLCTQWIYSLTMKVLINPTPIKAERTRMPSQIQDIICNSTDSYFALYNIMRVADHPVLRETFVTTNIPRQSRNEIFGIYI